MAEEQGTQGARGAPGPTAPPAANERLPLVFSGIVTVEILVILALYWAGVHFAS